MQRHKWARVSVLLASLALVAAGCRSEDAGPAADSSQDACQADQFGCVTYKSGEPIKIGTALTITGNTANLGLDSQRGATLAADNLDGKLDGTLGQLVEHPVQLVHEDTGCNKQGGQAAATKLA